MVMVIFVNKTFSKFLKPFLAKKVVSNERITLTGNNEIVSKDSDSAPTLNSVFFEHCD